MAVLGRKSDRAVFDDGPVPRYEAVKQFIRSRIERANGRRTIAYRPKTISSPISASAG